MEYSTQKEDNELQLITSYLRERDTLTRAQMHFTPARLKQTADDVDLQKKSCAKDKK